MNCTYEQARDINIAGLFAIFWFLLYSYASVSLTVNFEALRAGKALASEPSTIVKINQATIPLRP
jgi:hypothetical protein